MRRGRSFNRTPNKPTFQQLHRGRWFPSPGVGLRKAALIRQRHNDPIRRESLKLKRALRGDEASGKQLSLGVVLAMG